MPNHIPSPERKRDLVLIGVILSAAILWQAVRLFPSRETQYADLIEYPFYTGSTWVRIRSLISPAFMGERTTLS